MRGQVIFLEAVTVFSVVLFLLLLALPLHVDISDYIEVVRANDEMQVTLLAEENSP